MSSDEAIYGTYPTARRDAGHEPGRFPAKGHINKPLLGVPARGHPGHADDDRGPLDAVFVTRVRKQKGTPPVAAVLQLQR